MTARWKPNIAARLPIPCPKCGHKQHRLISELRTNPKITCPSCGAEVLIEAAQLDAFMKSLEGFGR